MTNPGPTIDTFRIEPPEVSADAVMSALGKVLSSGLVGSVAVGGASTVYTKSVYVAPSADCRFWYFLTGADSRWAKLTSPGCSVSLTIASTSQPWGDPHVGLGVAGRLVELDAKGQQRARRSYLDVFPAAVEMLDEVGSDTASLTMFALQTVRLEVIDTANIAGERCELHPNKGAGQLTQPQQETQRK